MEGDCDELIEFVAEQMAFRVKKFTIKKNLELKLYGEARDEGGELTGEPTEQIGIKVFETISSRARKRMTERANRPAGENRGNAIDLYESIIADQKTPIQTIIKAQIELDKILGTEISQDTPEETTKAVRAALREGSESFGSE